MIRYTEKGYGLHEAIARAGHWLAQSGSAWASSDDVAVQAIIDGYSLVDAKSPLIAKVKVLARNKILAFLPDWKQSNMNARMNELNEARFNRPLTVAEQAEVAVMRQAWAKAIAIRSASDEHEAKLFACETFAAIMQYNIEADWPA